MLRFYGHVAVPYWVPIGWAPGMDIPDRKTWKFTGKAKLKETEI